MLISERQIEIYKNKFGYSPFFVSSQMKEMCESQRLACSIVLCCPNDIKVLSYEHRLSVSKKNIQSSERSRGHEEILEELAESAGPIRIFGLHIKIYMFCEHFELSLIQVHQTLQ